MSNEEMRIGDFAAAAGVSARTVRYYIVEGLLPPPKGAGLGAMYNQAHLDRLRLILRLKDTYLPLKEIRRQLTGLDDAGVRSRLAEFETAAPRAGPRTTPTSSRTDRATRHVADAGSAADYLQRLSGAEGVASSPQTGASQPFGMRYSAAAPASPFDPSSPPAAPPQVPADPDAPSYPGYLPPGSPLTLGRAIPAAMPPEPPAQVDAPGDDAALAEHWVRLKIGDDVELLVRSGAYHRLRDRIDWLLGWARAIFR